MSDEDIMEMSEEKNRNNIFLNDNTANPAPLGLCAFGMTTILLSLHNAGLTALGSPILAMAIFYGGIAQVIVGIMEWKKNNTFGMVTFGSFGFFWISFATLLMLPALGLAKAPQPVELAAFLSVWGIFAAGLFICTLKMHRVLQVTLLAVVLLVGTPCYSTTYRECPDPEPRGSCRSHCGGSCTLHGFGAGHQ